jgi:hypothetical protein
VYSKHREFPSAEIAVYCNMQRLELVIYPVLGSMAPKDASIEKMTEDFVTSLLVNFPNTVNTVFRYTHGQTQSTLSSL